MEAKQSEKVPSGSDEKSATSPIDAVVDKDKESAPSVQSVNDTEKKGEQEMIKQSVPESTEMLPVQRDALVEESEKVSQVITEIVEQEPEPMNSLFATLGTTLKIGATLELKCNFEKPAKGAPTH